MSAATNAAGLAKAASLRSRAFVTFLAGNGDYVKGVIGLAKGLRKGCIVREIEPVYPPENQTQFAMAYYVINYSKLRIWEDFLNMFFRDIYKPIPSAYNLVLAMLWRHPENIELEKVKLFITVLRRRTKSETKRLNAMLSKHGAGKYVTAPSRPRLAICNLVA
ncbi:unnamed protein product [Thlaspi arvense]|uniref:Hexosyltransferase n=1 Tax=Thlaspi arvense TaxID=13288 RepID=A0AAU9RKS8_THLAR|nr:unnamed protein product [Thlaspi arvense]